MSTLPNRPEPQRDAALHLAATEQQITAPHYGALQPLLPARTLAGWLADHASRLAPAVVTTAAWALARLWHQQLPDGSTQPLWIMGAFTALAAAAGTVAAAKRHGDKAIVGTAYAAGATCAMVGIAAHTPHWALSLLLGVLATAAAYGLCAPHWRTDRRERLTHARQMEMQRLRAEREYLTTALEVRGQIEVEQWRTRREEVVVEQIVAASAARTARPLAPGEELNVDALLRAAGHSAPQELPAAERGYQ